MNRIRAFRPGVVVGLVLLAVIAIAVTPTPRASAIGSLAKYCKGDLNVTGTQGQEVTLEKTSTWDTDHWTSHASKSFTVVRDRSTYQSHWQADSGFARGCSTTVVYRWPGGSAEFYMTFPYDGKESAGCVQLSGVKVSCDGKARLEGTEDPFLQILVAENHLVLP